MNMNSTPALLSHFFVDLELTGLDTNLDDIVEFGIIGTDATLTPIFRQRIVVRPTQHGLDRIYACPPVLAMHTGNGLLAELEAGKWGDGLPSIREAERLILDQIAATPRNEKLVIAGSGVWHCDLRFLRRHTPTLAALFDDREILDAGIDRRNFFRATGKDLTSANRGKNHRADTDIQCSLEEAQAFDALFKANALVSA